MPAHSRNFAYRLGKGLHPLDRNGEDNAAAGRDHFRGDVAEVLAYDRPLSSVELSGLATHLDRKWDLGLGLDGSGARPLDTLVGEHESQMLSAPAAA